jgi:hypothetical protein
MNATARIVYISLHFPALPPCCTQTSTSGDHRRNHSHGPTAELQLAPAAICERPVRSVCASTATAEWLSAAGLFTAAVQSDAHADASGPRSVPASAKPPTRRRSPTLEPAVCPDAPGIPPTAANTSRAATGCRSSEDVKLFASHAADAAAQDPPCPGARAADQQPRSRSDGRRPGPPSAQLSAGKRKSAPATHREHARSEPESAPRSSTAAVDSPASPRRTHRSSSRGLLHTSSRRRSMCILRPRLSRPISR